MEYWSIMGRHIVAIPVIMLVFAPVLKRNANHMEKSIFNYNSKRAKETPDTWYFANTYAGNYFRKWGIISLIGSAVIAVVLYFLHVDANHASTILFVIQVLIVAGTYPATEHALKEKLDKGEKLRP